MTSTRDGQVIVLTECADSAAIVDSNILFLNALFREHIRPDEVSHDAARSYYVDFYLAQMNNGGFSQFVYNSKWERHIVDFVSEGLAAIGAAKHATLLEQGKGAIEQMGPEGLKSYLLDEYFGDNVVRDFLSRCDDEFFEIKKSEDLTELNAGWLRSLPNLVVMTREEARQVVAERAAALPDREQRIEAALAAEPRPKKLIRAICLQAGHDFKKVTTGNSSFIYEGQKKMVWNFITDKGHHYIVEVDGSLLMIEGSTKAIVAKMQLNA